MENLRERGAKLTRKNVTKRNKVRTILNPTAEQSQIRLATLKPIPFIRFLREELPTSLSRPIEEEQPQTIFELEDKETATLFSAIAWQNQQGSRLFLVDNKPDVMVQQGDKVNERIKRLVKQLGEQNELPRTIYVKVSSIEMMTTKKMVLGLLKSYQSDLKFPNKLVLKETKTDDPGDGNSLITFSVKGRTDIEPITVPDLSKLKPSLRVSIEKAFDDYQKTLAAGVVNGFQIEDVAATKAGKNPPQNVADARRMFANIQKAAESLLDPMIPGKGRIKLDESELAIVETLQKQVDSAIKDGFKNELDTARWKQWGALEPLTEDQIVPGTRKKAGEGAQGLVFKYQLIPALGGSPIESVLKYDNNGLNSDAKGSGIPEGNPQQSVRAVAAFKISERLELGVIPQTQAIIGTDENGRPKLGQAMAFVTGTIGQRRAGIRADVLTAKHVQDSEYEKYKAIVDNPGAHTPQEVTFARDTLSPVVKVGDHWYRAENFPVDIVYDNPVVQRGLSDLQVFDYIIGHADRNPGNWIYEKDEYGHIIGVKGIDNDDTFGSKWEQQYSKTPGIPPILDISTALSILKADFNKDIKPLLAGLSSDEKDIAAERFDQVQQQVVQRVRDGNIASIDPIGAQAMLEDLRDLTNMPAQPGVLSWGPATVAAHTRHDSYLGNQKAQIDVFATQYGVGVAPESGPFDLV